MSDQDLLLSLSLQFQLVDIALDQGQYIVRCVDIRASGAPPASVGAFGNMLYLEIDRGGANFGQSDEAVPIDSAGVNPWDWTTCDQEFKPLAGQVVIQNRTRQFAKRRYNR